MKKVYYLISGLVLSAGAVNAQTTFTGENAPAQYATSAPTVNRTITPMFGERDADDIIWSNDFSTEADWVAGGPSDDYTVSGWSIGTAIDSWYGGFEADMGTDGNFARFRNGNTDEFVSDGPFTLTYNSVIDLSGVPAPHLEFEQYGARFITLQAVEVSIDGGTTWVQVGNNDDIAPLTAGGGSVYPRPQTRRFNIGPSIAGGEATVQVRLSWNGAMNGPSMNYIDYGWYVDNIRIVEGHSYDSDIQDAYFTSNVGTELTPFGMEYYKVPLSQAADISFAAETINQGGLAFSDLKLDVDVSLDGSSVFSGSSDPTALAALAADSLVATTTFLPTALGTHTIKWSFSATEEDSYSENDEMTKSFEVTDYEYARHNGVAGGSISNFAGNTGSFSIGNDMHIFNEATVGGMYITITDNDDHVGKLFYGQIFVLSGDSYTYLAQTPDHEVTAADNGSTIFLQFEDVVNIPANSHILVLGSVYNGGDINFASAQSTRQGTVVGISGDGSFGNLIDPNAVMITLDMRDFTGVEEEVSTFSVSQNMPNPFGNNTIINYELNSAANVSVEIVDVTGKVVNSINNGTQTAGAYTLELDAADYAEGVYYYTFTVGSERVTKRMVVTK